MGKARTSLFQFRNSPLWIRVNLGMEIVEHGDTVPSISQRQRQASSDETCSSGNQNFRQLLTPLLRINVRAPS